ncbi:hypothetical protein L1987_53265 [Smallanthus sonchifolius]|uniref:Uncharacterized protein n=1 Tax=Smallanthus sonchifolius TaxID=185202 RepID=A0ACB9EW20_9ASTR|nr:hypothetical protein L1987_53265 [Smallanthus sonchifolius]
MVFSLAGNAARHNKNNKIITNLLFSLPYPYSFNFSSYIHMHIHLHLGNFYPLDIKKVIYPGLRSEHPES